MSTSSRLASGGGLADEVHMSGQGDANINRAKIELHRLETFMNCSHRLIKHHVAVTVTSLMSS